MSDEDQAGVTPGCAAPGGGGVVVGAGESPAHGEGPQESSRDSILGDDTPAETRWIPVPELQQRLARKAVADPEHRFGGLYDLLTWESVLDEAADRLLANKGSRTPGLDGLDREKLRKDRDYHRDRLRRQLRDGTFRPTPVKRVYIPKKNGKMRPLGIPTLYDRWVQMALKLILEPIFEGDFLDLSHGFRPNRSCHTAMAQLYQRTIQRNRKVYWVIEGDIEGFFDHVHHKKLLSLLRQRIRDKRLLDLLWRFLRAGVMEGRLFKKTEEGTPQGGVLSPLLANIYLTRFDRWFADRALLGRRNERRKVRAAGGANFQMVRYADDFVVVSNGTRAETEAFKAEMKAWLADELKLTLSEEKTAVTHYTDGFDFLGFTVKKAGRRSDGREVVIYYPSTASVRRAVRRVTELTARSTTRNSPEDEIAALNTFLRGWGEYFRHSSASKALSYVGNHAYRRMWRWLVVKQGKKHGWRAVKAKYGRENTWQAGKYRLLDPKHLGVDFPRDRKRPHPYLAGTEVGEPESLEPFAARWTGHNEYGADWTTARETARERAVGRCVICGNAVVEVHHRKAKAKGGDNAQANLAPLCRRHHRAAERRNSAVSHQLREIPLDSGEPGASKGARPVRGEGL